MIMDTHSLAIQVNHLTKIYKLFSSPGQRLLYQLFHTNSGKNFCALDDISFNVRKGESFAVIGKNGCGKSTLLQILSGIIGKTHGDVVVNGKIAALLELGSGFDPDSTGYENIYMNAAILGANKDQIEKKLQEIISFADIGDYLYQPVKTYSSGMYVRLGFSVAIHVDADILLVDEALAVGDIFFRQKCYAKLNELKERGTTILLVTHNMSEVEQFCDRAIYLQNGKIVYSGKSSDVVQKYFLDNQAKQENAVSSENGSSPDEISFENGWQIKEPLFYDLSNSEELTDGKASYICAGVFNEEGCAKRDFQQGDFAYFYAEIHINSEIEIPVHAVIISDQKQIIVHGKDTLQTEMLLPEKVPSGWILRFLHIIKLDIAEGEYTFTMGLASVSSDIYNSREHLSQEELHSRLHRHCSRTRIGSFLVNQRSEGAPTKMLFHGICDLPGSTMMEMKRSLSTSNNEITGGKL